MPAVGTSQDTQAQTLGGYGLAGLLVLGAPLILRLSCGDPFTVVCAAASLSLGTATVIHTSLGGLGSNNLEIEGQGDKVLDFLPKIGIKGRFTAATAVFCATFMLFIGASILLRKMESREQKVKELVPKPEQVELHMIHKWGESDPPPQSFMIKLGDSPFGLLTEKELSDGLAFLANDGFRKKINNKITSRIAKDCNLGEGVCKTPDRLKITVSFSSTLKTNEANVCGQSELWDNVESGDILNITPYQKSTYIVPIKPNGVNIWNDSDACTSDGKAKTPEVWIQLSEVHSENFIRRKNQFTTGWLTIQKKTAKT